ncbi:MAG: hypothetical protein JWO44_628 [Bacteroidetes bacterium]|nr:hypothetical protein [Bacteroidota bacterium]
MEKLDTNEFYTYFKTDVIEKHLFPHEKKDLYAGLKVLNLSLRKFIEYTVPYISDGSYGLNLSDVIASPISKIISNKVPNCSQEEDEALGHFVLVGYKIPLYMVYYAKQKGLYETAFLIANHFSDIIDKLSVRMLPETFPDVMITIKELYEKEIVELNKIKIISSKQLVTNQNHFQWQGDEPTRQKLHDLLRSIVDIDYEDFKSLFEDHNHKVNWSSVKPNLRQIAHLFHSLCDSEMIYKPQSRYINKIITDRLLINGKSISLPDLKKSYSHFKNKGKSKSQQIQAIDNIIQELKK